METYRILISDFDSEITSLDISWVGRKFRWETVDETPSERFHSYLLALAENTRKPPATCMALAAKHQYVNAEISVLTPEQVVNANTAACSFVQSDAPTAE